MIYYVSKYTDKEIKEKRVIPAKYGDRVIFEAVDIDGYNLVGQWYIDTVYTKDNRSHTFYYEPFVSTYSIVFHKAGGKDLATLSGNVLTDETIILDVPYDKLYGYEAEEKTYDGVILKDGKCQFTAGGWGDSTRYHVRIPCYPVDVDYTIYYKYGKITLADPITGTGKYGTTVYGLAPKTIEGYQPVNWSASLPLDDVSGCEYTFQYTPDGWSGDAPFPPRGPISGIEIEPEEKGYTDLVRKIAEAFADFFLENWNIMGEGKDRIGYRTFVGADKQTYVIAGYCELKYNSNINNRKDEIVQATNVDKKNIIFLTDDEFKKSDGMEVLWNALISTMSEEEMKLLSQCTDKELELKGPVDGKYVLEELSFDFKDGTDVEVTYGTEK